MRVRRAVEALAPGQREAVLAFYWQGLTHAETAMELEISPGAVKARLHQARAVLAPRLTACVQFEKEVPTMAGTAETTWVDVEVVEVRRSDRDEPIGRPHAVVLQEREGTRRLPIYVGAPEAVALACTLEAVEMPRPMTYQLATSLVVAAGSRVTEVRIAALAASTFYAVVVIDGVEGHAEVDARPSDALNLALVAGSPIRVDAAVLDNPEASRHTDWEQFPTRSPDLVDEVRERQGALLALLAEQQSAEGETPRS